MTNPLIGMTTGRTLDENGVARITIPDAYIQAVSQPAFNQFSVSLPATSQNVSPRTSNQLSAIPFAEDQKDLAVGLVVLIPPGIRPDHLENLLPTLDGVLFTGGGDIDPSCYGSNPHPLVTSVDLERDRLELVLFQKALERELPVLGICRGLQLFNVALGGTLYEDLADQYASGILHDQSANHPREHFAHPVDLAPGTQLAEVFCSQKTEVNSLHHQGICDLAPKLVPSAKSPDGLIEAVEIPAYPFGLAVQWHPECLLDVPSMQRLFSAFFDAACSYRDH